MNRLRITVQGRVQGVGFRRFAGRIAQALGVAGFARNERDGSVTIEAEAPPAVLTAYLAELQRGPRFGRVDALETIAIAATGSRGFTIEP
jgi:acylphosphatase